VGAPAASGRTPVGTPTPGADAPASALDGAGWVVPVALLAIVVVVAAVLVAQRRRRVADTLP